jgi:signal transduction histidine kinase
VINRLVAHEIDEILGEQKTMIGKNADQLIAASSQGLLKKVVPDLAISSPPGLLLRKKDSLFNINIYDTVYRERIPYRAMAFTVVSGGQAYLVTIRRPLLEAEDLMQSIVLAITLLLIAFVTGLLLLNRKLSKKIWKPFYSILSQLRNYEIDKSAVIQPAATGINEFDDLSMAIHELTQRNSKAYASYREFTENASHEMQTPLAIFQSKLELLIQTQPFSDEQASLVNALSDVNSRLIKLNKSLLLLTKIENYHYHETEKIQLTELTEKITGQLKHVADVREIAVTEDYSAEIFLIANRSLMEILFSNLFSNAIRYNTQGGRIVVSTEQSFLVVKNTSVSGALDPSKIFDRFYKQHANAQSIGLGLAISKKIAELYGLSLDYSFEEGWHVFRVGMDSLTR